jgi:5-methyltetrahydropteroyltriglutamate--homocysteine methyltransferase
MKRSTQRILTTHTGSLPRPPELLPLLRGKDGGEPVDRSVFESAVKSAVAEVVRKQQAAGLDVVNDGEMGKISYSTYVKDRLTGFEGESEAFAPRQIDGGEFPEYYQRFFASLGSVAAMKRPACTGPISYRGKADLQRDLDNFKESLNGVRVEDTFLSAASPGVISMFLANKYYRTNEAYLGALADAMKTEYEAIAEAGFLLQLDCPDLAVGDIRLPITGLDEFRKNAALHVDALNQAVANIPPDRMRLHVCWGNSEGPHNHDVALKDLLDIVLKARPAGLSYVAANPRHEHEYKVFRDVKLPDGKVLIPGVIDSTTNFIEHPELIADRICNLARIVGRENVIAGTDCGFGTVAGFELVDSKVAWAKLKALAEGARLASVQLW